MKRVKSKGIPVIVCEPTLDAPEFFGFEGAHGLEGFEERVELLVANRWNEELADVEGKVYTRDLVKRDLMLRGKISQKFPSRIKGLR